MINHSSQKNNKELKVWKIFTQFYHIGIFGVAK